MTTHHITGRTSSINVLTYDADDGEYKQPANPCWLSYPTNGIGIIDIDLGQPDEPRHLNVGIERQKNHWKLILTPWREDSDEVAAIVKVMDEPGQVITQKGSSAPPKERKSRTNADRANGAAAAVAGYSLMPWAKKAGVPSTWEEDIVDLLTDLRHLAAREAIDLDEIIKRSEACYNDERIEACPECERSFGPHYTGECEH